MDEIVFLEPNHLDAEPFTTSKVIAEGALVQHHTATRLIQKHEADFLEFEQVRFKIDAAH